MQLHQFRSDLTHTHAAIARGQLTVGYLGGSITDSRSGHNWSDQVTRAIKRKLADKPVRVVEENSAIGATGSDLGVFNAEPHILDRGCDLVFVEYAVNDNGVASDVRGRSREGLIRKLLASGQCDVVLVYTFAQGMYDDMIEGHLPDSIAELEALGERYRLNSAWMGLHALREVQAGRMRWDQWLPDGLHPQTMGSSVYAECVMQLIAPLLDVDGEASEVTRDAPVSGDALPEPLDNRHWASARRVPLTEIDADHQWVLRRVPANHWMGQVWEALGPDAELSWTCDGTGLLLGVDWGTQAAAIDLKIDDHDWRRLPLDYPAWCGPGGWLRPLLVTESLAPGAHRVRLRTAHADVENAAGTTCRLALIGTWG